MHVQNFIASDTRWLDTVGERVNCVVTSVSLLVGLVCGFGNRNSVSVLCLRQSCVQ